MPAQASSVTVGTLPPRSVSLRKSEFGEAVVACVEPGSAAGTAGLLAGDRISRIDGEEMRDLIDFSLLLADDVPHVLEVTREGAVLPVALESGGNPGVQLAEPVFGRVRTCNNRCVFCFVDQLPGGLRPSVYLKDDDYRLSFLCGNFITMTNLSRDDVERIVEERLSPLYVSLHATDPALRREMFGNKKAPGAMAVLGALLEAGIEVHLQIVLMKGVNDGDALDRTLSDLLGRFRDAASIGVVPVGVSLAASPAVANGRFDRDAALRVLEQLERWRASLGALGPFAADEFFFLAGLDVPACDYYLGFPQLENGIGLTRYFRDSFEGALSGGGARPAGGNTVGVVTTPMGAWALSQLVLADLGAEMVVCENSLFGRYVTVLGLLPGGDIARALGGTRLERALVSDVALDARGEFMDGMTPAEVSRMTGTVMECVPNDGTALYHALTGY